MDLEREDYQEPRCPFDTDQWQREVPVHAIPINRAIEKLDECYSRGDLAGAERVAKSWISEAQEGRDLRGEFAIRNELMGIYRKTGKKDPAIENAEAALDLVRRIGIQGSISEGTALVNAATVYKAFEMPDKSIDLFEKAKLIYEKELDTDWRLGGLYNNMALTLADLGRLSEAKEMFGKALDEMQKIEGSEAEQAVTWLNLADLAAMEYGLEAAESEIRGCCGHAVELLDSDKLARDGNYAFYCEKCAPVFDYYGFFMVAEILNNRAKDIYERS